MFAARERQTWWEQERVYRRVLTVDGVADGVRLGVVAHTADELGTVTLAVVFDGVYLWHGGRGVRPEDGLAVLPAGGVAARIAAARGAHLETHTHQLDQWNLDTHTHSILQQSLKKSWKRQLTFIFCDAGVKRFLVKHNSWKKDEWLIKISAH